MPLAGLALQYILILTRHLKLLRTSRCIASAYASSRSLAHIASVPRLREVINALPTFLSLLSAPRSRYIMQNASDIDLLAWDSELGADGKKSCPSCGKRFHPKGLSNHRARCLQKKRDAEQAHAYEEHLAQKACEYEADLNPQCDILPVACSDRAVHLCSAGCDDSR